MLESTFKTKLIKELKALFPGCMVFHLDPSDGQGLTDIVRKEVGYLRRKEK